MHSKQGCQMIAFVTPFEQYYIRISNTKGVEKNCDMVRNNCSRGFKSFQEKSVVKFVVWQEIVAQKALSFPVFLECTSCFKFEFQIIIKANGKSHTMLFEAVVNPSIWHLLYNTYQCHACWWLGDGHRQAINRHGTELSSRGNIWSSWLEVRGWE